MTLTTATLGKKSGTKNHELSYFKHLGSNSACFGSKRSWVQIPPPRPSFSPVIIGDFSRKTLKSLNLNSADSFSILSHFAPSIRGRVGETLYFSSLNTFLKLNTENKRSGGISMDFIEIKIRHFTGYIKRGDIKAPTWFALDHDIVSHPDFFEMNGDEFKAFIRVVGIAAHLNEPIIRVYAPVVAHQAKVPVRAVVSCIEKLKGKRWDVTNPYGSVRESTGNIGPACPTLQDTTLHNSTVHVSVLEKPETHPLVKIWNENCGELPRVEKVTEIRAKKIKKIWAALKPEEWLDVARRVAKSDFCNGRTKNSDWRASFDWFIGEKQKVPNYLKVLEGNFDGHGKKATGGW